MAILREEFADFEKLHLPAIVLSKKDMIKDIQETDPEFAIPSSMMKSHELSIHYVSMRYILKNSQDTDVIEFKNYCYSKNLNDDFIARVSGIFYSKSSNVTHNIVAKLSLKDIEVGLGEHGITDINTVIIVKALFAIRRGKKHELN
jgi:hypothetical protein